MWLGSDFLVLFNLNFNLNSDKWLEAAALGNKDLRNRLERNKDRKAEHIGRNQPCILPQSKNKLATANPITMHF